VSSFKTILYLYLFCAAVASCSSLKGTIDCQNRMSLSDSTLNLLAGKFKSSSIYSTTSPRAELPWNVFDRGYNPKTKFDFVEIKPVESNKLLISYWDSKNLIKSKVFEGKLKNDYFVFKRRYLIVPAILANLFRARSFRIGLLPNGNLITDYKQIGVGSFYVLLPYFDRKKEYGVEFEKLN
jgi:hypothetical protein